MLIKNIVNQIFSTLNSQIMATKTKSAKTKDNPCWKGYKKLGTKIKAGKKVPDCVPEEKKKK